MFLASLLLICIFLPKVQTLSQIKVGVLAQQSLQPDLHKFQFFRASVDVACIHLQALLKDLGYYFNVLYADSGCNETLSLGAASKLIYENNVSVLIGPTCSKGKEY